MKVCITGERYNKKFKELIREILVCLNKNSNLEILVGDCSGVDTSVKEVCQEEKIPFTIFKANWDLYGLSAGPRRNREMIEREPDLVLAFHSNLENSKGTKNTINLAKSKKIPVKIYLDYKKD